MIKEDIKKAMLTGIVSGITAAVTLLGLLWGYIFITDWYRDYQQKRIKERIALTPPDKRSGDFCPECKSSDVGKYFYGLYRPGMVDSATKEAIKNKKLIPGGCTFSSAHPKYRCNSCSYEWANFK